MVPSKLPKDPNATFRILEGVSVPGTGRAYAILTCGALLREGDDETEMLFGEALLAVPTSSSRSWKLQPLRYTFGRRELPPAIATKLLDDHLWRSVAANLDEYLVEWRKAQGPGTPFPPPYAFQELDPEQVRLWLREVLGSEVLDGQRWTLSAPLATYLSGLKKLDEVILEPVA